MKHLFSKCAVSVVSVFFLVAFPVLFVHADSDSSPSDEQAVALEVGEVENVAEEQDSKIIREADQISDPFEGWNRFVFGFNNIVDRYLLEPIAIGYDYVTPEVVQGSVSNFFDNLEFPIRLVSGLLQGKVSEAGLHTTRFLINSTVGLVGLFEVAEDFGFEKHPDDLGLAFRNWGIGPGPFVMLPFFGPSNFRDATGMTIENFALDPMNIIFYTDALDDEDAIAVTLGSTALDVINTRAGLIEAIDAAKEASTDLYLFVQGAYYQDRDGDYYFGDEAFEDDWADDDDF